MAANPSDIARTIPASELAIPGSHYTADQKREAATVYAIKGSDQATADLTGIPRKTICDWRKTDWWDGLMSEVRQHTTDKMIGRFTEIVDSAMDQVILKLPEASAKDAAVIAAVGVDKMRILQNQPTSISASQGTTGALQALASQFAELSASYKAKQVKDEAAIQGESEPAE